MGRVALEPDALLLGKYRVERVLGRGGMGVVVRARHLSLDEVVAIKVLGNDTVSPDAVERFIREAKSAAKLKSAHAVRVTDVGQLDDGEPYMTMELLDGCDLAQLRARGPVEPALAVVAAVQACEVLAEAHALGIVHRDIKSSNLFLTRTPDGAPFIKVLDFGIAKVSDQVSAQITQTTSMLGTPAYMSPEQLRSAREVDHRTDLWALGVVLYELIEGQRPFDGDSLPAVAVKVLLEDVPPPRRMQRPLAAVVLRCLEKDPDRRFQSATDLAAALAPFTPDPAQTLREVARMGAIVRASEQRIGGTITPARGTPYVTPGAATQATHASYVAGLATPPSNAPSVATQRAVRRRWPVVVGVALLTTTAAVAIAMKLTRTSTKDVASSPAPSPDASAPAAIVPSEPVAQPATSPPDAGVIDAAVTVENDPQPSTTPKRPPRGPRTRPGGPSSTTPKNPRGSADEPCDPLKSRFGC